MALFKRFFWPTLLIVILAGAGFWLYQQRSVAQSSTPTGTLTQVVTVQQGNLSANITVVGQLESNQQADLTFDRLNGTATLLTQSVAAGNTVEAGQMLATIDPTPYTQALDLAQNNLLVATQKWDELQTPPTELQMAQAEQSVAQAELALKQALADLDDLQKPTDISDLQAAVQSARNDLAVAQAQQPLVEHDSLAKSERDLQYAIDWNQRRYWEVKALVSAGQANLEQTQSLTDIETALTDLPTQLAEVQAQHEVERQTAANKVSTAQLALSTAQQALADAQPGADALALAQAQVAVQKATVAAQSAWDARTTLQAGPDPVKLTSAQAALVRAQQAVTDAEANLAGATLTAPFAGTVLQANAAAGDLVSASSVILTLANLNELQVVAAIDETTIRQVAAGQPVLITFDAFPGQAFSGQVLSVPLQGALQGGVMVYQVPISLAGAEGLPLLVGMTANASISVGQADNALLVPSMAVQSSRGGYTVLVPNPRRYRYRWA